MKKIFIGMALVSGLALTGCNDSFLDKTPVTDLTEENAFSSYANFQSFMWPCYEMFTNTTIRTSTRSNGWGPGGQYDGDVDANYFNNRSSSGFNQFAYQTVGLVASGNGWNFSSFIRRINIMLSHIDASDMTQEEKDHWRAVGYFFHSFWYMELIDRFGDIPWVDKVLTESSEETYGPRVARTEVADKVLERLQWAEQNIGDFESQDGDNAIDRDCVRAALSRFTLREGTWRKYHSLEGADKYLEECVRVSEDLMADYPDLYQGTDGQPGAGYGEMWTTADLNGVPGVILYKEYVAGINAVQGGCYLEHTSSQSIEVHQSTVDLYLMKNGLPIHNPQSGYYGDKTMYDTFRDRDPRLYHTVIPPYKVEAGGEPQRGLGLHGQPRGTRIHRHHGSQLQPQQPRHRHEAPARAELVSLAGERNPAPGRRRCLPAMPLGLLPLEALQQLGGEPEHRFVERGGQAHLQD